MWDDIIRSRRTRRTKPNIENMGPSVVSGNRLSLHPLSVYQPPLKWAMMEPWFRPIEACTNKLLMLEKWNWYLANELFKTVNTLDYKFTTLSWYGFKIKRTTSKSNLTKIDLVIVLVIFTIFAGLILL